jgi:tetratricopeptide (TPR) repeat protein
MSFAAPLWSDSLSEALSSHRYQDAIALADVLLRTNPDDPRIWTARGASLTALGRDGEGLTSFERALELNPQFAPALKGAVESAYRIRDGRTAALLDRLLRLEPQNGVAHAMAATLKFEGGDCRAAITHFEQSLAQIATNEEASYLYAACLVSQSRSADTIQILQPFTLQPHVSAGTWNLLASAENAAGNANAAIAHLSKAIDAAPQDEQNYIDLAALYIQHDSARSALPIIEAGLKQAPKSARLHAIRGVVKGQIGTEQEAAADFELANQLDPGQQYGAAGLGVLYTSSNQIDLASAVLRKRLKTSPDDPTLNYLLAEALIREDVKPGTPEFNEISTALRRALRVKPDFGAAHIALGKLDNRSGDYTNAVGELKAGLRSSPSDRTALSQLAIALRHLGRTDEAAAVTAILRQVVMKDVQTGPARYASVQTTSPK